MAKIFVALYTAIKDTQNKYAIPHFYESFCNSLKKLGNDVFAIISNDYDNFPNEIPKDLTNEIQAFNPDLAILFNNAFFDIAKIIECPIVVYEVDSPLYYQNKMALQDNIGRYKFLVAQSKSVDIIKDMFNAELNNIRQVPFFTEIQAINEEKKYNISIIASKFCKSLLTPFAKFMQSNPSEEEVKVYKNLIDSVKNNPFITEEELFNNVSSEKIKNNFLLNETIFFLSDYERINLLRMVADLGVNIWGTDNWITDLYNEPDLILAFHPEKVYTLEDNQRIYNQSKIGISKSHLQAKSGFPWRIFDIMASNACLVTEYHKDFDKYLQGINLPCYENIFDARELCKKLLSEENYRLDIVAQCQNLINEKYRFKNILEIMKNFLDMSLQNLNSSGSIKYELTNDYLKNSMNTSKSNLSLKNNLRYKIWHHYDKLLRKKGIIK